MKDSDKFLVVVSCADRKLRGAAERAVKGFALTVDPNGILSVHGNKRIYSFPHDLWDSFEVTQILLRAAD